MSGKERKTGPRKSAKAEAAEAERRARQAAQLRANLLKRKEQSRGRAPRGTPAGPADKDPADG